jgi:xanthine dehydrogenase accessory factor
MSGTNQIVAAAQTLPYERAVLVTLVKVEGSSFRKPGARMLVTDRGEVRGCVAGGCLETTIIEHAQAGLEGTRTTVLLDTTQDADVLFGHGVGCPGKLYFLLEPFPRGSLPPVLAAAKKASEVRQPVIINHHFDGGEFQETLEPPFRIVVFGAGNSAIPLVRVAAEIGYEVIVVDARAAFATTARFPEASRIVVARPESLVDTLSLDVWSSAVLLTHNVLTDAALVELLLGSPVPYIGVVGSRTRVATVLGMVPERGRDRVFGPVGLDIGAESPAQIALAVLAEIEMVRSCRSGGSLRDRARTLSAAE